MTRKIGLFVFATALAVMQCGKDTGSVAQADAGSGRAQLKALLDKATVVDVRTPAEFAAGHHPRAINIPVDQVQSRLAEFGDKSKPVVVYCASGSRSGHAKRLLEAAGFRDVTNAGGFYNLP